MSHKRLKIWYVVSDIANIKATKIIDAGVKLSANNYTTYTNSPKRGRGHDITLLFAPPETYL